MKKPLIYGIGPFPMFIFSSLTIIFAGLIFQFIGLFSASLVYHIPTSDLMALGSLENDHFLGAVKWIQIIGGIGTFIFSSLLLSFFYTGRWLGYFESAERPALFSMGMILLIMVSTVPLVNYLTDINNGMTIPWQRLDQLLRNLQDQTEDLMMKMVAARDPLGLIVNLFMIAVLPGIGEELVFRGLIQRHLQAWFKKALPAVLVTSVIFSLAHFEVYSFLPRFFLGIVLGYMMVWGRSIWYPIFAHFVNNAVGVLYYYFSSQSGNGQVIEEVGTRQMAPFLALVSLVIVILLMVAWKQMVANRSVRSDSP